MADLDIFRDLEKDPCVASGRSAPLGCSRTLAAEYIDPAKFSIHFKDIPLEF
jgi:hypothetical protein